MTAEQFIDAVWQLTGAAPAKNRRPSRPRTRYTSPKRQRGWCSVRGWRERPSTHHGQMDLVHADAGKAPAGQTITFRRQFKLPSAPAKAVAVITCDNEYRLFVNGRELAADDNWETVEVVAAGSALKAGDNEILIVGKNAGSESQCRGPDLRGIDQAARMVQE